MRRLHTYLQLQADHEKSAHWYALKEQVVSATGIEPFAQIDDIKIPGFRYLHSHQRTKRFEILEGDEPYTVSTDWTAEAARYLPENAGPVEIDLAGFIMDKRPDLGVLVGGMGSGKSTTLRHLHSTLKEHVTLHYLNSDRKSINYNNPPSASALLVRYLSPLTTQLMEPEEEFGSCWDWGLARYGDGDAQDTHNTSMVFERAVEELRLRYKGEWRRSDAETIAFRIENLHALTCSSTTDRLDYLAFKIDYFLSVRAGGKRNAVCIILDNIDPLPPKLQRELLVQVSQFQLNAQCKILLAMRPLTYSLTHEQRANRTVKVLQHIGPPALELIEDRIKRLIINTELPRLSVPMQAEGRATQTLQQNDFKAWARQVIQDIKSSKSPGGHRTQEPSALEFIEGLCNNSLRSALLVAEKIFGSPNLPMVLPDEPPEVDKAHITILKNHEIVRAVLLGKQNHYIADINRVTDNVFDLGDATSCFSPTCKFRILKELASAPGRGILSVAEITNRLRSFGFDDEVILEAVNGVISQVKRLAWSDMVVAYTSLNDPPGSRLSISRAGRFYVDKAIYCLEYVQETHVDALLPEDIAPNAYSHKTFSERADSLYRFVRYIHDVDLSEVREIMVSPAKARNYYNTYGAELFSSDMATALSRQVINVGNSLLRRHRPEDRLRGAIGDAIQRWRDLPALLALLDSPIVDALRKLKGA